MNRNRIDIENYLIMSETNFVSIFLNYIDIIICISSSYFYAYLGAFYEVIKSTADFDVAEQYLLFLDIYFTLDIIKCFLTDFTPEGERKPVRNFKKIAKHYLENAFIRDFILWVPLFRVLRYYAGNEARLVLFVKCTRIIKGFKIFNVLIMMKKLRTFFAKKSEARCLTDFNYRNDQLEDHNLIVLQIYFQYGLLTIKMVVSIFNIVFFMSIFWYVLCDLLYENFLLETDYCKHKNLSWRFCSYNNRHF